MGIDISNCKQVEEVETTEKIISYIKETQKHSMASQKTIECTDNEEFVAHLTPGILKKVTK